MTEATPRVMIMAGGTGGHIFPALAVAKELEARHVHTVWLGSKAGLENKIVPEHGIKLITTVVSGLRGRGVVRWLIAPLLLSVALMQSIAALLKTRPGVVLGMGGFASGPGGVAAWLCRIPLLIHEQNAKPGLTNALLSRFAAGVFQAFPDTFAADTAVTVGNPVRNEIRNVPEPAIRNHDATVLRVLIIGGSRGARTLNEQVPLALAALPTDKLAVWHQCGDGQAEMTRSRYPEAAADVRVDAFIDDMAEAYAWADLLICRAGAMTVSEIMAAGVAAVLVPFPYATGDHQTTNARYLVDRNAAVLVPEGPEFCERLGEQLQTLLADRQLARDLACRARELDGSDAASRVSDRCCEILNV